MGTPYEDDLLAFEWLGDWEPVPPEHTTRYEDELRRELPSGHVLEGKHVSVLGKKRTYDDYLFLVHSAPPVLAYVHLTWSKETNPTWPWTEVFKTALEWVDSYMRPDSEGWPDDAAGDSR